LVAHEIPLKQDQQVQVSGHGITQEREAMVNEHSLPVGDDPSRQRGPVVAAPPHEHHPAPPHNIRQKSASSVGQVVANTL